MLKDLFLHLFLPHHTNNQRAKFLHPSTYFIIGGFLIVQSFILATVQKNYPRVLGEAINITQDQLLKLTNQKRAASGLTPLKIDTQLTQAAQAKANFMLAKNFWAHNSPDGVTPWSFFKQVHYDYIYAGENLARGFNSSQDVIDAWMASPDHRENMLSPNYADVGFAEVRGSLTGEKDTTLVVEELGSTESDLPPNAGSSPTSSVLAGEKDLGPSVVFSKPLVDVGALTHNTALVVVLFFLGLIAIDLAIIRRRGLVRVFEHNADHVLFLSALFVIIMILGRGSVY